MVMKAASVFLCLLATTLFSPSIGDGGDTLTPNQALTDDGTTTSLVSAGGIFELGFFTPVGSTNRYIGIWFHNISVQIIVWIANRHRPIAGSSGRLSLKPDGTLIITEDVDDDNSTIVWSSSSPALGKQPVARLLEDGNFVVVEAGSNMNDPNYSSKYAWQSFDFPTDTLLSGMKVGWTNLSSGLNHNLTSWRSVSDPAPGEYTWGFDRHGDPQLFVWSGTRQYERGGRWNGFRFSGVPDIEYFHYVPEYVADNNQLFYSFHTVDPSLKWIIVITHSGIMKVAGWIDERQRWNVMWFAPKDLCDAISPCGPYGICDSSTMFH